MGNVCRWLAEQAESLGIEVFPGFSAHSLIIEENQVKGIVTGDMGLDREGQPKDSYMPGMELRAKYTVFAEGCRGHLGKQLIKEWQIDPGKHKEGTVVHGTGWPLTGDITGGSFMYHAENNQVVVGLIVDLNYSNPHLSPFDEFQRMKHHPVFKETLEGGERIAYGARAIAKGGFHSLPKMHFPGGLLIGCDAGTLNFAKIKGNHTAMKSGMLAADAIIEALTQDNPPVDLISFADLFKSSWLYNELYQSRNFGPVIHKFGGKLSFDKLSSVFLSNTNHEEVQPCHLQLKDKAIPININLAEFDEPAQRYCPAGVYEISENEGEKQFVINAQNCIHCKTCDIKDPSQNITWVTPEGTGGPNYPNM